MGGLAELLGLQSVRAARRFVKRHGIPYVAPGRRMLVLLDSLLAFLKAREVSGDPGDRLRTAADRLRGERAASYVRAAEKFRDK